MIISTSGFVILNNKLELWSKEILSSRREALVEIHDNFKSRSPVDITEMLIKKEFIIAPVNAVFNIELKEPNDQNE